MSMMAFIDELVAIQKYLYGGMTGSMKDAAHLPDFAAIMGTGFLFGCIHALMPGHGKSVLVSYHLGNPSRLIQGAASAVLLSVTHVGLAAFLVLVGVKVVSTSLSTAGRAPAIEVMSAAMITLVGLFLAVRTVCHTPHDHARGSGAMALAAGFVPCPLTTFVLTYAIVNGRLAAGITAIAAMLTGIAVTLTAFAVTTILFRERLYPFLERSHWVRHRLEFGAELLSAFLVMAIGGVMLVRAIYGP